MDPDRTKRLQAILQWSLRQQEEEGERLQGPRGIQVDPEAKLIKRTDSFKLSPSLQRQRWLKEALEAFSSQPNETDLLKAALAVLKVHCSSCIGDCVLSDAQLKTLEEAFEQVKYFIEDLDHANDLIPLKGVEDIVHYLNSENMVLTKLSCELIAIASQNNPPCQRAFLPTITRLLQLVKDSKSTENIKIQAVRAISKSALDFSRLALSRSYQPGVCELLIQDRFSIIIDCLCSGIQKVIIKTLFMISSFYTMESNLELQGLLNAKIGDILSSLAGLLKECGDTELLEHLLSLLSTLLHNRLAEVKKHRDVNVTLKDALVERQSILSPVDHKDELEKIKDVIQRISEVL